MGFVKGGKCCCKRAVEDCSVVCMCDARNE